MQNHLIIQKLLDSCISNKPYKFFPYLFLCRKIKTRIISKYNYFIVLKRMLNRMHKGEYKAIGKISVQVKPSPFPDRKDNAKAYYFYDEVHQHERMYILIEEQPGKIILDLFPF